MNDASFSVAGVGRTSTALKAGDFVILPRDTPHVFRSVGSERAVTFNMYAPPAY